MDFNLLDGDPFQPLSFDLLWWLDHPLCFQGIAVGYQCVFTLVAELEAPATDFVSLDFL